MPSPSALRLLVQRSPSAITARKKPIACVARIIVRAQFGMWAGEATQGIQSAKLPQNLVLDNHKKSPQNLVFDKRALKPHGRVRWTWSSSWSLRRSPP